MRNIGKWTLIVVLSAFIIFTIIALRPVPAASFENSDLISGKLSDITAEGGPGDIVFTVQDQNALFYINNGIDQGLIIDRLRQRLLNGEVEIYYSRHWTPLDPFGKIKHINRIEKDGQVIYNEILAMENY